MRYYNVAVLGSILDPLTYQSEDEIELNSVVSVTLNQKVKSGVVIEEVGKPTFDTLDIISVDEEVEFEQKVVAGAKFISQYYSSSLGEALNLFIPSFKQNQKEEFCIKTNITLSDKQQEAYEFTKDKGVSLIFGDTGSGKTEIYIERIAEVINRGKSAIFLLPEISLTPQIKKRLEKVFGETIEIWHSKITTKTKEKVLTKIKEGRVRLIVGARSSLFLPLQDIGLIIVDEEHDDSYKNSNNPQVNVKDFAIYYGRLLGANVILGSATPLATSFHKFPYFRLKGNYYQSKQAYVFENSETKLTDLIIKSIDESLAKEEQVIVFVPTRANFKVISCSECGTGVECPYCSVNMSMHKNSRVLKCHYCNFTTPIPKVCSNCGSEHLQSNRIGTAEIAEQLQKIYPDRRVAQFDRDEIRTHKVLKDVLNDFNTKQIDILVGTQMLSKGHDYHDVSLSVILGIDNILNIPDYRSREKALSTAIQVAGRSGRKKDGKVIIQTLNVEFFQTFMNNYEVFLEEELGFRKPLYPPFARVCRILVSHTKQQKCIEEIERIVQNLNGEKEIEIVGYGEAAILKISNKFRYNILLRSQNINHLLNATNRVKTPLTQIDIDPISFS